MWVLRLFVFENIEIFRLWTESSVTCANDSLFGNAGRPTSKSEMKIEETKKSVIFLYRNLCDCAWQTQKKSHTEILISYRKKPRCKIFHVVLKPIRTNLFITDIWDALVHNATIYVRDMRNRELATYIRSNTRQYFGYVFRLFHSFLARKYANEGAR